MFLDEIVARGSQAIFRYPDVLAYLKSRHFTDEDLLKYHIGYLRVLSVPEEDSIDRSNFMDYSNKGRKFEHKILFPLRDSIGRVMGLIGRGITSKSFKIFATEEAKATGFFFGLHVALPEAYRQNCIFVTEGPFDAGSLAKVHPNTVGALTAGVNQLQYDLLRMYCDNIVLAFDSDEAGRRAAEEASHWEGVWDLNIGFHDPSNCLETLGEEKFKKHVERKLKEIPLL